MKPTWKALQMKGRWESNINVWFRFMCSQKWNCYFQNRLIVFCLPVATLIYLWEIYIFQDQSAYSAAGKYVDRSWEYINRSQTHACGNWDWGRAIPRKITHKWYFPCSAGLITGWLTSSSKLVSMIHIGNSMTTASPANALQGWWETRDLILLPETHTHACKLNPQGSILR